MVVGPNKKDQEWFLTYPVKGPVERSPSLRIGNLSVHLSSLEPWDTSKIS